MLAAASDGVGTKLAIAQAIDKHDTVGRDLVAMCVDDLVVCGAEPLFLQDYIAVGKVIPETVAQIVSGIADGCVDAGCALLGGETAEHPGLMQDNHYDLSATAVGVVEADEVLSPDKVRAGDVVIGMGSSGLHSNGYSLARKVLLEWGHMDLFGHVEEFGRTLGEELLEPTRIYARACLDLVQRLNGHEGDSDLPVRAFSHVTGGGLAANLARVLPQVMGSVVELIRDGGEVSWRGYVSGDTLYRPFLGEVLERCGPLDVLIPHLGGTKALGLTVTMDARQGADLVELLKPPVTVPVHYDDYDRFKSPLGDFVAEVGRRELPGSVRTVHRGETISLRA